MDKLAAVVPVYGSPGSFEPLVSGLCEVFATITDNFEIILVDDHCPKGSWSEIESLCAKVPEVIGIKFSKNFGQHYAILAGLRRTTADYTIVMDCDLQDDPKIIPDLYAKVKEGYDKVYVKRQNRQSSKLEILTSKYFYKVLGYLTDTKQDPSIGNFGIYSKKVVEQIARLEEISRLFPVHARWVGFRECTIEKEHSARFEGISSYTFRKRLALAIDIALAFSDKPLWMVIYFGFFISCFSIGYAFYIFVRWLVFGVDVEGWTSLIISIWSLSGIIIAIMGIVGIYVAKTFDETKNRPLFIVDEELNVTNK